MQVTATPSANFLFGTFSGDLTGTTNPQSVVMSQPRSVTGNFVGVVTATITTNPPGLVFRVDGIQYNLPQTFTNWAAGSSHAIGIITNPQIAGGTRNTFANWSDGGLISHSVTERASGWNSHHVHGELDYAVPVDAWRFARRRWNAVAQSSLAGGRRLLQQRDSGAGDSDSQLGL